MAKLDERSAIVLGGWDPRYAVVLAVVAQGNIAAALIDSNGDGADIDLDQYSLTPEGEWLAGSSSGGAGDEGQSWSPDMVAAYGRSTPDGTVRLEYLGEQRVVTATDSGWWLFITPPRDEETMVRVLS